MQYCTAVAGLLLLMGCETREIQPPPATPNNLADILSAPASAKFARATEPRKFRFPQDHAAHPNYRTEWWYLTGRLRTATQREFGVQATFFRYALAPKTRDSASTWRTGQVIFAHFAVTDIDQQNFYHAERLRRESPHLAGFRDSPFEVWVDTWSLSHNGSSSWYLNIDDGPWSLRLQLDELKSVVLQGEHGLSQKGREAGNASYYYSLPRLAASGTLQGADDEHAVHGSLWLDREWSTSALDTSQAGWDWFAIQLSNNHELMFYRLRQHDGSEDIHSRGVWVRPNGDSQILRMGEVKATVLRHWETPSGVRYPVAWRLAVPALELLLELQPVLDQQFLDTTLIRYWEGLMTVSGSVAQRAVKGSAYLEMTGYE